MTVSYTQEVATCRGFGCFVKLLARWRASVYKLIWQDLLLFLSSYYLLSLTYRFLLDDHSKYVFESVVYYCNNNGSLIPLAFVLGFYVQIVMKRWWDQYISIPWPDSLAVYVSALVRGQDDRGRLMRRTVMRYVCLTLTMVFSMRSPEVKRRFPTLDQFVDGGMLLENEKKILNSLDVKFAKHAQHWIPVVWAASIITRARKEGRIWDDFSLKTIIDELNKFRGKCNLLLHYDFISIPLVYTQVVALTVYTYFAGAVIGGQWTDKMDKNGYWNVIGYYFPVFSTLEFFFFMGWMKLAESMLNPFGTDDDDFEVATFIERNLQVSYLIVDDMHHAHPELVRDQYWDEVFPTSLPYPIDYEAERNNPPEQSTAKLEFPPAVSTARLTISERLKSQGNMTSLDQLSINLERSSSHYHLLPHFFRTSRSDSSSLGDSEAKITELMSDDRILIPAIDLPEDEGAVRPSATSANILHEKESFQGSSETESENDNDFERLKEEREKKRLQRYRLNMVQSLSKVAGVVADIMRPSGQLRDSQETTIEEEDSGEEEEEEHLIQNNKH